MKRSYLFLTSAFIFVTSITTKAQTIIDGSFENCSSTGNIIAYADYIQANNFTPCGSTTNFFGGEFAYYSNGNQGSTYLLDNCYYYSPMPSDGNRVIGFGNGATLAVKLTENLVAGNCYTVTFDGLNSPGDNGQGNQCAGIPSEAFSVGVSSSSSSFGTSVGTSATLAPAVTQDTFTPLSVSFVAPSSSDNYITITMANQANTASVLVIDNMKISQVACELPVKLLSFNATENVGKTLLNWTTASEINNKGFYIQYSKDAINWEDLGFLSSKNSNSNTTISYSFTHNSPANGVNYYRLKQVDFDEQYTISKISTVHFYIIPGITIYPNPITDNITIEGLHIGNTIQLMNAFGQTILAKIATTEMQTIPTSNLPNGIYNVIITDKETGQKNISKIMKQ